MIQTVAEGRGERELKSNRYTVTTRMISALIKMGSDVSHFNVSLIVYGKVTRQCPQMTFFKRER